MIKQLSVNKSDVIEWAKSNLPDHVYMMYSEGRVREGDIKYVPISSLSDRMAVTERNRLLNGRLGMYEFKVFRAQSEYASVLLPKELVTIEEIPDLFDIAEEVLSKEMPGRYYIFKNGSSNGIAGHIYLYYPTIVITNTIGDVHTINDLVVKLETEDGVTLKGTSAKRYSYDENELKAGYTHSHVDTGAHQWNGFCFGSTPFANFYKEKFKLNPNKYNFSLFLAQFETYLNWESLEGKPYKSISELNQRAVASDPGRLLNENQVNAVAEEMLVRLTPDMLVQRSGVFQVDPFNCEEKLLQIEVEAMKALSTTIYSQTYCLITQQYVRGAANATTSVLPSLASLSTIEQNLVQTLGINRRIIPVDKPAEERLVTRATATDAQRVIARLNELLIYGYKINE